MYLMVIILAGIFLLPLLYVAYNSFLPLRYVQTFAFLDKLTLNNYKTLMEKYMIGRWYLNTIVVTLITVAGNIFFDTMAGYALARFKFPGRNTIFILLLITMMFPFQLIITPLYIMVAKLGWHNTIAALTVPYLTQALFVFMARQFSLSVPSELEEATKIDGLSRAGTFFKIIIPISKTLIATICIFNFTGTWNSYIVPATFTTTKEKFTLVVGLNTVNNMYFNRPNLMLAGIMLLTFPVIVFFVCMQKYFVQGIATSGLKG